MKTTHVRAQDVEERWLLFDASQHTLGRMATTIAMALMGKDRPTYTPSEKCGAHVVVINGNQPKFSTDAKAQNKIYPNYTGYQSGLKLVPLEKVVEKRHADVVTLAVRRMLPKNRLGHDMLRRLKVYPGTDHPHTAQQPVKVEAL
jgi:large subunit ribosomal protein L13